MCAYFLLQSTEVCGAVEPGSAETAAQRALGSRPSVQFHTMYTGLERGLANVGKFCGHSPLSSEIVQMLCPPQVSRGPVSLRADSGGGVCFGPTGRGVMRTPLVSWMNRDSAGSSSPRPGPIFLPSVLVSHRRPPERCPFRPVSRCVRRLLIVVLLVALRCVVCTRSGCKCGAKPMGALLSQVPPLAAPSCGQPQSTRTTCAVNSPWSPTCISASLRWAGCRSSW